MDFYKEEKFGAFLVDREGSDVMVEISTDVFDEFQYIYFIILSFNETEGFKIIEPKAVLGGKKLEEGKPKSDDLIYQLHKIVKNDNLFHKYKALF